MKHGAASAWIRLSDLMTAVMMVFLLISVLYISEVQKKEQETKKLFIEYNQNKKDIHAALQEAFKDKFQEWDMVLDDDLTIKFNNPEVLFDYLKSDLTPKYKSILDEFLPTYLSILNNPEYRSNIKEVRIEGHTAYWDDYMYSIKLSQERSNAVLGYIFQSPYYNQLTDSDKEQMRFWLTSNGLGFGRAVDDGGKYVIESKSQISPKSRRVEFRIVTSSETLVDTLINKYQITK